MQTIYQNTYKILKRILNLYLILSLHKEGEFFCSISKTRNKAKTKINLSNWSINDAFDFHATSWRDWLRLGKQHKQNKTEMEKLVARQNKQTTTLNKLFFRVVLCLIWLCVSPCLKTFTTWNQRARAWMTPYANKSEWRYGLKLAYWKSFHRLPDFLQLVFSIISQTVLV